MLKASKNIVTNQILFWLFSKIKPEIAAFSGTKLIERKINVVYRHPDKNAINIDRFSYEFEAVRKHANILLSCNSQCLIEVPIRISSSSNALVGRTYTNSNKVTKIGSAFQ